MLEKWPIESYFQYIKKIVLSATDLKFLLNNQIRILHI